MLSRLTSALSLIAVAAAGPYAAPQAGSGSPFADRVIEVESPAALGSGQPSLTVDRSGRVWMSWLEAVETGGQRLRVASRMGSAWSPAVTVAEGETLMANWADIPAVFVTSDGVVAVSWLERGPGRGYGVRVRTSNDEGRNWTPTVTPHRDDAPAEHGFVSFFQAPGSGPGLIWLDGRDAIQGGSGNVALRAATLAGGRPGSEMVVDARVCDCCQTSAARIDGGAIVAYRDRTDDEIRDISVARFQNGRWSAPRTVHADNWQINACPVNGPAVAASGRAVAVAWFTMASGAPEAKVAFSTDAGESFSAPSVLSVESTIGRLGLAMLDPNHVLVSSIERGTDGAHIVVRAARRNGRMSEPVHVAAVGAERPTGFPRMAATGREVIFAWTDAPGQDAPTRVRVATARLR